ncbi:hypothetical protein [Aliterella atlantica]|uniref:Uncharacterized protein n=1 Tax=Aliterella atlantica CENA595 TaxID=1618023 RepID=A0A0D8ZX97_9CYAN|nr:hypothetical protein [Aliterella atlantica]KJH73022.1 hypothetical protein UH38_02825 [Aliterella atlantica CENA595]
MDNINALNSFAIAQISLDLYLPQQVEAIASQAKVGTRIPQRKANYSDKTRIRFKDAQGMVFRRTGLKTSSEVKKYLKVLKISLDLRLTSAWREINLNLVEKIVALITNCPLFKVGDRVYSLEYSPSQIRLEPWSPFVVRAIADGMVVLE